MNISNDSTTQRLNDSTTQRLNDSTTQRLNDSLLTTSLTLLSFLFLSLLLSCTGSVSSNPSSPTPEYTITFNTDGGGNIPAVKVKQNEKLTEPQEPFKSGYTFQGWYKEQTLTSIFNFNTETITSAITIYAKWKKNILNASMAWVSMREGLVQFDNGTQGVTTIGVIVSKSATAPAYTNVKDLPGFYTRKTKIDGTPRTVYLSMTDKMTSAKFNADIIVSIDGGATGFVSAIASAPELLHPNTNYYAHFYNIANTTGTAVEKLEFTTEDFPATFPTTRIYYSSFYNIISASTSPAIEYKASESSLIPFRLYYVIPRGGPYAWTLGRSTYEFSEPSPLTRPFNRNSTPSGLLFYDLYNITPSGPSTSVALWDGMVKQNIGKTTRLDRSFGGNPTDLYSKKLALVTE